MALNAHDVGHRVVVRRAAGERDGRPVYSDVLGELVTWGDPLVIRRSDGAEVTVASADVVAAKRIPPRADPPARARAARHRTIDVLELERIAALGWPGLETAEVGGWLLRAGGGWSGRANSALPLGGVQDVGSVLAETLAAVRRWYADRHLRALVQVPLPTAGPLHAALLDRGWADGWGALVMTGGIAEVLRTAPEHDALPPATFETAPSEPWLERYRYRGCALPAVAVQVLMSGAHVTFASLVEDGEVVATVRTSTAAGWVGLTAVEVDPARRRRGLATHLMRAALGHAADRGAHSAYLQVEDTNVNAQALYTRAGFTTHHTYRYLREPTTG